MTNLHVNFLENPEQNDQIFQPHKPKRRRNWRKIIIGLVIIFIISVIIFSSSLVFFERSLAGNLSKLHLFKQVGQLITSKDKKLNGEDQDRVNFLIIGQGGKGHQGGTLADTIIMATYKPSTNQVAMMAIPRDTQVRLDSGEYVKINAVSAYAESKEPGSGGKAMTELLTKLLGTDIHYYVTIDFDGFEKVIDDFGGVDINVERDFVDYQYPIRGREYSFPISSRFEVLKIEQGMQHMDGALALKYARSRHAAGGEGSDFSRSKRQQNIIAALKDKVVAVNTLFNPKKIDSLLTAYNDNIDTNLEIWEILHLAQLAKGVDTSTVIHLSLTDGVKPLLRSAMINGAYVLLAGDKDFTDIKSAWEFIFYKEVDKPESTHTDSWAEYEAARKAAQAAASKNTSTSTPTTTPPTTTNPIENTTSTDTDAQLPSSDNNLKGETAKVEIRNGTWTNGLANKEKERLINLGFTVSGTTNADNHEYAKTVIYNLSGGNKATAKELSELYNVKITNVIPDSIVSSADFVVILGLK